MVCKINMTEIKHLFSLDKEEIRNVRNFLKAITDGTNDGVDWKNVSDIHIYSSDCCVYMDVTVSGIGDWNVTNN